MTFIITILYVIYHLNSIVKYRPIIYHINIRYIKLILDYCLKKFAAGDNIKDLTMFYFK